MRPSPVLLVSVFALVASACSGSDSDPRATGEPSPTGATIATEPADSGATDTLETGTVESTDNAGGEGGSLADFCAAISAIQSAELLPEETFGPAARPLFERVQAAAPPAISGDVTIVVETLDAMADIDISTNEDDPEAIDAALEILLDPEFTQANQNLAEYTSQECGIELDGGDQADLDDFELDDPEG